MRQAPANRHESERILAQDEGWTHVKVTKPKVEPAILHYKMLIWCDDHLGPGRVEPNQTNWLDDHDVWYSFTWYGYYNFYFKHSKDAVAFTLRWL